ncbi:hypothetical protein [Bradyrhizobium sp. 190]|uniref:hypothetical protein n=1 Tax=Bradyrhizobium sp. 190 TaxID=2782658 RepID=UPI0035ABA8C5
MWAFFERLLDSSMFAPHGICLLWEPQLIWLHVASDIVIASAYFSIPVALSIFVSKRRDVDFGWVFWAFALFIMACGVGHVMSIITLWYPIYGIEGIVKAMTAASSIVTAAMLWPLLPKVLALPSPSQLRAAEVALAQEGMYRREAEDMPKRPRVGRSTASSPVRPQGLVHDRVFAGCDRASGPAGCRRVTAPEARYPGFAGGKDQGNSRQVLRLRRIGECHVASRLRQLKIRLPQAAGG